MKRPQLIAGVAIMAVAGSCAIAVPAALGGASAAVAPGSASSQAASSAAAGAAVPFGAVAGGFAPLAGGQVAHLTVGAGKTVIVAVAGHAGVPAGAAAAALAVATSAAPAAGTITVYPAGGKQPSAPDLVWPAGRVAGGQAVAMLSAAGKVSVANTARHAVTVTIDATGYWLAGSPAVAGAFGALPGGQVARVAVGAGKTVTIGVAGHGGVPKGTGSVSLAVATSAVAAAGSVAVYPAGAAPPAAATVSWASGQRAAGLASVQLSAAGKVNVTNTAKKAVTVTVDATGYWLAGTPSAAGAFGALPGARVAHLSVGAGKTVSVTVTGHGGMPASGAGTAALTLATAATPAAGTITVYASGSGRPGAPTLAWGAGQAATGHSITKLPGTGKISIVNTAKHAVSLTISAAGYWLAKARTVAQVTKRPTTTSVSGSAVTQVTGSPDGTQTVTLAAGAAVPALNRVLVAGTSKAAPDGLLGTVTAVAAGADGTHTMTIVPASLSQAYSTFNVSTSQQLTSSEVTESSDPGATRVAGSMLSPAAAASGSGLSFFPLDLSKTSFDCSGSGAGPTIAITADLSQLSVDLSLDTNPSAPSIHFLVTSDPVFDINLGFTGQVTCKLAGNVIMEAHIPVPAVPGLVVDFKPVLTLTAGGQASVDFQWKPRAALGFDKGPGISTESHGFGSSGSVTVSATAGVDLFLGLDTELTLFDRIGVGGDFGPDLSVSYDAPTGCVTVDAELKADLTADANVFVKDWTFALASGIFLKGQIYQKCIAVPPGPPVISSLALPQATVGKAYSAKLTTADNRAGTWKIASGALPAGLSLSGATIGGTPTTAGTSNFTLSFTDAHSQTATQPVTLVVAPASGGGSGEWTASQIPVAALTSNGGIVVTQVGISCASATFCVAVGGYGPITAVSVLTWSGGTWSADDVPVPANQFADIGRVSCPTASFCVAAGVYEDLLGNSHGLLVTWSDGTWTVASAPAPADAAGTSSSLTGISCASAAFCTAIGAYTDGAGNTQGDLLTWSGGAWTAAKAKLPAGAEAAGQAAYMEGVSCPTASFCTAVGVYDDASGIEQGMLLTWSGGTWTAAEAPLPADAGNTGQVGFVNAVSCPTATYCVAVGSYDTTSGSNKGLVFTWSGGTWKTAVAPLPAGAGTLAGILDVSCASASLCNAVGAYTDSAGNYHGLLLTLSAGTWAAADAPAPGNAGNPAQEILDGVSCPSASFCAADGYYNDTAAAKQGVFLTN